MTDCTMTALLVAAYNGDLEIVQMLLHTGKVHVNQQSSVRIYNLYVVLMFIILCYRYLSIIMYSSLIKIATTIF